jgi:tetratricopeptide (TPR) repeat protein
MKRLLFVLVIQLIPVFVFPQSADSFYEKSEQKFEQGQSLDALELIERAIEIDKSNIWYYLHKSEIEIKLHQIDEALGDVKHAIRLKPNASEPYNRLALLYQSIQERDSALLSYQRAMKHAETDTVYNHLLLNRATAHLGFMEWGDAIKDLEKVLDFNPDNIGALNNISTAYKKTNQTGKAIQSLEKIIHIDSTFIGPYVNLGMIYTASDEYEKAMSYFNRALELNNSEPLTLNNRGFLWYKMKNYDRAIVDINRSIELYPANSYAYKNRALAYLALGKTDEGCQDLNAAATLNYSVNYGSEVEDLKKLYCK